MLAALRGISVVVDAADRVVHASDSAREMGLVRSGRVAPMGLLAAVREARTHPERRERELFLPRSSLGIGTRAVLVRVVPLPEERWLMLVEDRTETRRVEEIRRDFVANVSHELKTPIGAMALLAEALLDAADDPEAVRRFAGHIQQESGRLSDLVHEIIELSRLQGEDSLHRAVRVELDDLVAEAVDVSRASAAAVNIELVHGGRPGLAVRGDRRQLVMALRNLIDNAIHYSPAHTRVAVGVRRAGAVAEIAVTDQGIGIPATDLGRIFERFYRVDPARSRATGGTGLGLSIVKHVAANHGGEVTVWSVEGAGSTFTLRLPVDPASGPTAIGRWPIVAHATSYPLTTGAWPVDQREEGADR